MFVSIGRTRPQTAVSAFPALKRIGLSTEYKAVYSAVQRFSAAAVQLRFKNCKRGCRPRKEYPIKKHIRDILLICSLLAIGGIIALILLLTRKAGALVEVRVDGRVVASYPLDRDAEYDIAGVDGGTNHLVIRNGEAWVESASCPDGLCVRMGHIRHEGASVICLPNKVVIAIVGGADGDADVVSGR